MNSFWPRRAWLAHQTALLAALTPRLSRRSLPPISGSGRGRGHAVGTTTRATPVVPDLPRALAVQAVEAARTAGATYADARLTRVVDRTIGNWWQNEGGPSLWENAWIGVGVRVLVDGAWGFAASPFWTPDGVVRLARDAVTQARANAPGSLRPVDRRATPVVTGTWMTPIAIDPFAVPIEEMIAAVRAWQADAARAGCPQNDSGDLGWSDLRFVRAECVLATSEGSLVTQTRYESGGHMSCHLPSGTSGLDGGEGPMGVIAGLTPAGQGWERIQHANIPAQLATTMREQLLRQAALDRTARPSDVGRYTLVCDGATMAALVESTLGVATQLDRALGYEANASGTSFLDDPLAMVGQLQVASPLVTLTANRSASAQLATVQWDDDGIVPEPFPLVQDGVLVDFQTTREQAAWLAPYYQRHGQPVRSHGCAAAADAHAIPLQMMPNLALAPSTAAILLDDLVRDVPDGILIEGATAACDFQARTGLLLGGQMRRITHGKLGPKWTGGAVQFATLDLWKNILAVGGTQTEVETANGYFDEGFEKGEPPQRTSHSVRAVAATITNQPVIDQRSA